MKQKIIIAAIAAIVAGGSVLLVGRGCESAPEPRVVTKTETKTVTVEVPGDSVYVPKERISLRVETVLDSARIKAYERELDSLRDEHFRLTMQLAEYQVMTMVADTTLDRAVRIDVGDGNRYEATARDRLHLEADLPPYEAFRLRADTMRVDLDIPIEHTETDCGTPWWVQALIGLGGIVAGILAE